MPLRDELATRLRDAMRQRDRPVVAGLRIALGELANAEAIPAVQPGSSRPTSEHVAGALVGVGAAEAQRRTIPEAEQRTIVARTQSELLDQAARLVRLCRVDEADGARRAAAVLDDVLAGPTPDLPRFGPDAV